VVAPGLRGCDVRSLHRGGCEHESNLVPACGPCNTSKGYKLLTEWNAERVEYGRRHSPKVATELDRLAADEAEQMNGLRPNHGLMT
jgi:hypothetical protein